jgi:uncharacterized protein YodC (DUF2158 family)
MANAFKVGDIVKLKSGGPEMTIEALPNQHYDYSCQWFAGKKLERGHFPQGSLVRVLAEEE